eukprot:COSAG02_NODE_409_length_22892_cov_11.461150_15_plen_114_part_00
MHSHMVSTPVHAGLFADKRLSRPGPIRAKSSCTRWSSSSSRRCVRMSSLLYCRDSSLLYEAARATELDCNGGGDWFVSCGGARARAGRGVGSGITNETIALDKRETSTHDVTT